MHWRCAVITLTLQAADAQILEDLIQLISTAASHDAEMGVAVEDRVKMMGGMTRIRTFQDGTQKVLASVVLS